MKIRKLSKKTTAIGLSVLMASSLCAPYLNAATLSKKLDAIYRDIKVSFNGKEANMSQEPFINAADNSVYVPLRAFSEMTGSQVVWDNINNKVIVKGVDTTAKDTEIAQKNHEILTLRQKLSAAEAKLKEYENLENGNKEDDSTNDTSFSQRDLDNMVDDLIDDYGDDNRIEWDFSLKANKNKLQLNITYDSRYDGDAFDDLSDKKLESFVEDICDDIQREFGKVEIIGTIEDERYESEKANFKCSSSGRLDFESIMAKYEDLIYDLERAYKDIEGLSFDLPIEEFKLEERNGTLIYTVLVNLKPNADTDLTKNWNAIEDSASDFRDLKNFMFDVAEDIEREFDIDVEGYIRDEHSEDIICSFDGRKVVLDQVK